jgi:oligoribonuclease (3'-5' exoribonuclease)
MGGRLSGHPTLEILNMVSPTPITLEQPQALGFNNDWSEIRSLEEFLHIGKDSTCIAFDCEFVFDTDAATEVGLACCDKILDPFPRNPGLTEGTGQAANATLRLQEFVEQLRVQASSVKINERYLKRVEEISHYEHARNRDPFCFGNEEYINLADLDGRLCNIIKNYRDSVSATRLILVGYHMTQDIAAMRRDFPSLTRLFSAWMDVRTIMESVVGATETRWIPGIRNSLMSFGYSRHDYGARVSVYHNAGNDAVKTLAVLNALLRAKNTENLHRLQRNVGPRVILCEGQGPPKFCNKVVRIESRDSSSLPPMLQTANQVAAFL